jgi:hypothetical protein
MATPRPVDQAIADAERILPGKAAADGETDPRWQALIHIGYYISSDPEPIWSFALKWGSYDDEDLRSAVTTLLLEHLLEDHFDLIFPRVEIAARSNALFADTFKGCWKLGQAEEPPRAQLFDDLKNSL